MTDTPEELSPAPRAIKPRNRQYKRLPVIVVTPYCWINEDGSVWMGRVPNDLDKLESSLFVTLGAGDFVAELNDHYSFTHPESWQWRVTTQEKSVMRGSDQTRVATRVTTVVQYFGFKGGNYHKIIDPIVMYGRYLTDGKSEPIELMRWATTLRDFCHENSMEVRPTIGSMSAQFLTDRRFYPHARRKVPYAINDRARPEQPANYYALRSIPSPRHQFTAWYFDQRRAHHYHARTIHLPDANDLHACGDFLNLKQESFPTVEPDFKGLYCLTLKVPRRRDPMLHWIQRKAKYHFVFSNELPLLQDMGYKVTGVIAAWGSFQRDDGIQRYAEFAERQLDRYDDAPWLKPLLLATYGTLATRPSWGETIFRLAKRGETAGVYTGRRRLDGIQTKAPVKLEPKIANVIHRGMIEAATRAESIGLAYWLDDIGYRILSIYADAVMIEVDDDKELPRPPEPWRLKATLNHLQFVSKQAFISGEMTKLPGINREAIPYRQQRTGSAPKHFNMTEAVTGKTVRKRIGEYRGNQSRTLQDPQ